MSKDLIVRLREAEAEAGVEAEAAAQRVASTASALLLDKIDKISAERDALAAELKALREQEPVAWFSYSADAGFSEFKTFQEAINSSRDELNEYRNEAVHDGEWPEEVAFIRFGAILGRTTELKGETDSEGWVDFQLTHPVPARELTDETIQRHWDEACKDTPQTPGWSRHIRFARAIERHLKGVSENG